MTETTSTATVQNEGAAPVVLGTASQLDTSSDAAIAPASDFSPSGAPRQVTEIDPSHPAVDANPRAGTTTNQNRIDFNDPTISGSDASAKALGMKSEAEANDAAATKGKTKA